MKRIVKPNTKKLEKILRILSFSCLIIIGIILISLLIERHWYELLRLYVWAFAYYTLIIVGLITIMTGFLVKNRSLLRLGGILLGYSLVTSVININVPLESLSNWLNLITTCLLIFLIQKNVWDFKKHKKDLNEPK